MCDDDSVRIRGKTGAELEKWALSVEAETVGGG